MNKALIIIKSLSVMPYWYKNWFQIGLNMNNNHETLIRLYFLLGHLL